VEHRRDVGDQVPGDRGEAHAFTEFGTCYLPRPRLNWLLLRNLIA
jgi:hypothetical protein